ncbi:MAG: C40 family peptidase [Bacteroidota bacterium]
MRFMLFCLSVFFFASCASLRPVDDSRNDENSSYSNSSLRNKIVRDGNKCVGVKYKYAGRDMRGFDCSGFTHYVMDQSGIDLSPSSRSQATAGKKIPVSAVKPGDLVFFGTNNKVSHVALVLTNTSQGVTVVHSTSSKGVIIQNVSQSNYWRPRILFARDVLNR